jgi:hypothetical protein
MRKSGDFMLTRLWIRARRAIAIAMAAVMLAVSGPLSLSHAAMVSTDQVIGEESAVSDRERVMDFMAREDVRKEFEALGVDPDEALARAAGMSDAEVREIAGRLDMLPAGQSAIGAIVGAFVIVFIVLLITDLLGLTDVFSFVRPQR